MLQWKNLNNTNPGALELQDREINDRIIEKVKDIVKKDRSNLSLNPGQKRKQAKNWRKNNLKGIVDYQKENWNDFTGRNTKVTRRN